MDADVLIIGGGIAGISAAARLSELGRVVVLEGEPHPAHHAAGRSAAMYEPHYGAPPVVALSLASGDQFRALTGVLAPRGLLLVGGQDDKAAFSTDQKAMAFDPITLNEACDILPILNPDTVRRAACADHAWDIDADLLLQGFARAARGRAAKILTGLVWLAGQGGYGYQTCPVASRLVADLMGGRASALPASLLADRFRQNQMSLSADPLRGAVTAR